MVISNVIKMEDLKPTGTKNAEIVFVKGCITITKTECLDTFMASQLVNDKSETKCSDSNPTKLSLLRGTPCFYSLSAKSTNARCLLETWQLRSENRNYDTTVTTAECWGLANTHLFPGRSCQGSSLTNKKGPSIRPRDVLAGVGLSLRSSLLVFTGEWVFKWAQFAVCFRNASESN